MPFKAMLARYVGELAEASPSEINPLRIQLVANHQVSEEAFLKLYEFPQVSATDCEVLRYRYQSISAAAPSTSRCGRCQI